MQSNYINPYQPMNLPMNPNAVNINIINPQAYGTTSGATCPINNGNNGFYSLYGQNQNPNLPLYPQNYNNLALQQNYAQNPYMQAPNASQMGAHQGFAPYQIAQDSQKQGQTSNLDSINQASMTNSANFAEKTPNAQESTTEQTTETKTKKVVPLTDEYVKSLENYLNNNNPKIRLIGAKELLERFKEDENRKDNPSLMPLLNKALKDPSPSVRFLALTMLQLEYAVGNDETVTLLKQIQSQNTDKIGQDSLLASEIC